MSMLEVQNLHVYYGAIHALKGVSFHVDEGEIVSLIGANGAGKTTTLQTLSALLRPREGEIHFRGQNLRRRKAHQIVADGLAQVPEGRRMFTQLSVRDNLQLGSYLRKDTGGIQADLEQMYSYFPRLKERSGQLAGTLSGGEQQMLAIARALMSKPKLLLLDEPSMGLAPILVQEIFRIIKRINAEGCTILLVEQNARMALRISDRAYIMKTGSISGGVSARELMANADIQKAYLGSAASMPKR